MSTRTTEVHWGLPALVAREQELTELAQLPTIPVTARLPWLVTWARSHPSWDPVTVLRLDAQRRITAAALLAARRRGPLRLLVALGHESSDYARFLGSTEEMSGLADGITSWLRTLQYPWRLHLQQFPAVDPVLIRMLDQLPRARVQPADGSPMVDLAGFDLRRGVSKSARQSARTGRNRAAADGLGLEAEHSREPESLRAWLPELQRLHIARDRALGRRSDLEDAEKRAFWESWLPTAAANGHLEVWRLKLGGRAVCQLIAFLDGDSFRVWEFRIAPGAERYNPGHVLRDEVLRAVVGDPRWVRFDWMRGDEPYKRASATTVVPASTLKAWSSSAVYLGEVVIRAGRAGARRTRGHVRTIAERVRRV